MPRPVLRIIVFAVTLLAAPGLASGAAAQSVAAFSAGLSAGGTYYCIVSRCNTGQTVGIAASFNANRIFAVEAALRRHYCFDCGRFLIAETLLSAQYPGRNVSPFAAAGIGLASDPDLMGTKTGLAAAAGVSFRRSPHWAIRLELRGRQVGKGDAMGELSAAVSRQFGNRAAR